jgi:hypothetical protein
MDAPPITSAPTNVGFQFRLRTLLGFTLLIGVFCGLLKLGGVFVAAAVTITSGAVLVRQFAQSPYRDRARVVGTLVGGFLYLGSLWLPVTLEWDIFGWQAAWHYADQSLHLDYSGVLGTRAWDVANIWLINVGNLMAFALPPLVIARPLRLWWACTVVAAFCAVQAWLCYVAPAGISYGAGYWLWCVAFTVLLLARLMPFRWRFDH